MSAFGIAIAARGARAGRGRPLTDVRQDVVGVTSERIPHSRLQLVLCVEGGCEPRDDEWRAYSDGVGDLLVFCPECAEREFD
jgi:hypothetical protein